MDNQLMGEFEADGKDLEADSWSFMVDKKYLKQLKKDVIKRQDVIYGKHRSVSTSTFYFKSYEKFITFFICILQSSSRQKCTTLEP